MSPPKRPEQAGFDMGDDNRLRKIFIKDGKLRFEVRSILRPGRLPLSGLYSTDANLYYYHG